MLLLAVVYCQSRMCRNLKGFSCCYSYVSRKNARCIDHKNPIQLPELIKLTKILKGNFAKTDKKEGIFSLRFKPPNQALLILWPYNTSSLKQSITLSRVLRLALTSMSKSIIWAIVENFLKSIHTPLNKHRGAKGTEIFEQGASK